MSLSVRTDRQLLPAGPAHSKLLIEVRAPDRLPASKRPPFYLALVLDRSGSMAGAKWDLTLKAAAKSLRSLQPGDRFCVVLYNDAVTVLVPAVEASPQAVDDVVRALHDCNAGGFTDLGAGWLSGCARIGSAWNEDGLARCLLLTDGLANRGITDPLELERHAAELRSRGVTTSTIGVGEDFNEKLLYRLAEAGGGHYYFAENESQIENHVMAEVGSSMDTVAREVTLHVRAAPGVHVRSLNDDPCRVEGDGFRVELGSLRAGEVRRRMLSVEFPAGQVGARERLQLELSDPAAALDAPRAEVTWTRVGAQDYERESVDRDVRYEAVRLDVAFTRMRALDEQQRDNFAEAVELLQQAASKLRADAAGDERVLALAREIEDDKASYYGPTGKLVSKSRMYRSYHSIKFPQSASDPRSPSFRAPKLFLCSTDREIAHAVEAAYQVLAPHVVVWGIEPVIETVSTSSAPGARLDELEEFDLVRRISHAPAITIAFTAATHHDNWFSHWHARERVALVSLYDWGRISSIPRAAFAAYEMILHGLRAVSVDYEQIMHDDTRGCLFDFCPQKQDVEIKLQAGHICQPCVARLSHANIDPTAVGRLWSAVQQLAHSPLAFGAQP